VNDWLTPRPDSGCPLGLGNINGYTNRGCRCDACREANTAAHLDYMNRNPEQRRKQQQRDTRRWTVAKRAS
jgi:hypothetical protein